jgi:pimeloyl-ACP methyl ester carboxylesterase
MTLRPAFAFVLAAAVLFAPAHGWRASAADGTQAVAVPAAVATLATAPDQLLTGDAVTLRYREVGSGEPIVLLHGYGGALEAWTGVAGALASDHRVIAVDLRGFGRSTKLSDPKRYGLAMADDIVRLLDHLKIQRAHLAGHSMGALIAANIAARHKNRVITASLIAGPFYERAEFVKEVAPWIADLEGGRGLGNFLLWLFPGTDPKMAEMSSAQLLKGNDLPALIAVMRSLPDLVVSGKSALEVPSLVAVGTADPLAPTSRALAKAGSAHLLEIQGANHVAILSNPEVLRAMRELMQRGITTKQGPVAARETPHAPLPALFAARLAEMGVSRAGT